MSSRREELEAKRAKLAELKRQREQRAKELSHSRQSIGETEIVAPVARSNRAELDSLISSLVDRPASSTPGHLSSPARGSRPISVASGDATHEQPPVTSANLDYAPISTVYTHAVDRPEYITYSKGVQTSPKPEERGSEDGSPERRRQSRRERERDEELRQNLRKEIEEELRAIQTDEPDGKERFPARTLTHDELNAVTASDDFLDFVERSSKVIERALEEEYDVLADYARRVDAADSDDEGAARGRKGRRIRQVQQYSDEKWTRRRMNSDLDFSSRYPELLLASYTKAANSPHAPAGVALVWNAHMPTRPEYVFTVTSDLLCARFSPYHPNLIVGGTYSGQVCLWDTRQRSVDGAPVQRTPLAGERGGHAHPIYSVQVVGTQNASNIVSVSTDGTTCAWSFDMLSKPQEYLELTSPPGRSRTEDLAPTCISFPRSDPTYFLAGTEESSIVPVHRYDRAGAKAGVDQRIVYRGHAAPITGLDFHPSRGKVDLGDLVLSSSLDWSVKLWRVKPTSTTTGGLQVERPLLDMMREDVVYDVKWSPVKAGVFGCVDGAGRLEVFDLNADVEAPVARTEPSHTAGDVYGVKSLNTLAWEGTEGKRVAVGGLDGVVTVFEVGSELGGLEGLGKAEDWMGVKKLVARLDKTRA